MRGTRSMIFLTATALAVLACQPAAAQPGWTFSPIQAPGGGGATRHPDASRGATPTQGPGSGSVLGTVEVSSIDLSFEPKEFVVDAAGRYQVKLTNNGAIPHDITFPGGEKAVADPGGSATVEVDVPADGLASCARFRATPTRA